VVIDDLGLDRARTAEVIRLRGPLTLSFMTYASDLAQQTEIARRAGHELFLHVPMEAVDRHEDPGPHGLFTSQSRDEILDRLRWGLTRFDGFVGINNHMGSKFTADANSMAPVMAELHARGLAFLDSRTSAASTGVRLAVAYGVPHAARDVFLDDDQTPAAIAKELARTELVAWQRDRHRPSPRRSPPSKPGCRKSKGRGSPSSRSARWFAVAWQRKLNPSTDLPSLA
jgi:polysaccharide deacetylase 2 family uncharacterized protein YibQ